MKLSKITGHRSPSRTYEGSSSFVLPHCHVGLEYEVEQSRMKHTLEFDEFYKTEGDGSLKGDYAFEYVFREPLSGADLYSAICMIDQLHDAYVFTERCSLHVHLDVRDLDSDQLARLVAAYYTVEPLLFKYVGSNRINNNYCVPFSRATYESERLAIRLQEIDQSKINQAVNSYNNLVHNFGKYTALNLKVLKQFGSIEFRHHPGTLDPEEVIEWVNIIMSLKKFAMESDVPVQKFGSHVSGQGIDAYVESIFGNLTGKLTYPGYESDVMENIRHYQIFMSGFISESYHKYMEKFSKKYAGKARADALQRWKDMKCGGVLSSLYDQGAEMSQSITICKKRDNA